MTGPTAARLPGDRLHLQHGPIDLVITADGARELAFAAAWARFKSILVELCAELPLLRRQAGEKPAGSTARRMADAVAAHAPDAFITPMAAVAGAVADEILSAMTAAAPLTRAIVNNGGDIALHLTPGMQARVVIAAPDGAPLGHLTIAHADPVRGIATSGRGGRSFSLGIADAVTVLAPTAAMADAAATMIANMVDLPGHPAVHRAPASDLSPESDLGGRLVTLGLGWLTPTETASALNRGLRHAHALQSRNIITAAALFLNGQTLATASPIIVAQIPRVRAEPGGPPNRTEVAEHA